MTHSLFASTVRHLARQWWSAISVALVVLLGSSAGIARENARVLYQKGNAAFQEGDDILARHYYEQSLELEESFDTRCNLGRAEAAGKLWREAYFYLGLCLRFYPVDAELAHVRDKYASLRDDVRAQLDGASARHVDADVRAFVPGASPSSDATATGDASTSPEDDAAPTPSGTEKSGPPAAEASSLRKNRWKVPVAVSLAGAGVASGVVGGILLGSSASLKAESKDLQSQVGPSGCTAADPPNACASLDDTLKKSDSRFNAGVTLAAVGGGLVIGSIALLLLVPNEVEVGAVALRPVAQWDGLSGGWSAGLAGRF